MERLFGAALGAFDLMGVYCLPVGMIGTEPAGTGTVMRTETVRRYASEALFGNVEVLPIEHDFYRFYKLTA